MRRQVLTVGALCALVVLAREANSQSTTASTGTAGNAMPGQFVGTGITYNLNPVGTQLPRAAPPAGNPINVPGNSPMMRRADPTRPLDALKGTNLNASQIVAPFPGASDHAMLHQLHEKLKSIVGLTKVNAQENSTYFPSLTRRNRERAEARLWRLD
jgi:hypothetical protein